MAVRNDVPTGLEIEQDLGHERRAWRVQQAGRWLVLLGVLAGLAGLAGTGPASWTHAEAPGGAFRLEYERFARYTAPTALTVRLAPGAVTAPTARLWVDRAYLERLRIESVVPEPEKMTAGDDRLILDLPLTHPGAAATVTLHFQGQRVGPAAGRLGLVGGPELDFQQFFFP